MNKGETVKGVILACVKELVQTRFGADKWKEIHEKSEFKGSSSFLAGANVDDSKFFNLLKVCSEVLEVSFDQLLDAFAAHWVLEFAPKMYKTFYTKASSAKEFIKKLDYIHEIVTKTIPDSTPPRYDLEWPSPLKAVITYKSNRGLVGLAGKLLKQVGVYYKTKLNVTDDGKDKITVIFPS